MLIISEMAIEHVEKHKEVAEQKRLPRKPSITIQPLMRKEFVYLFLNIDFIIALPIFRSSPAFEVGMPVLRANCCLTCVKPIARFHENDNPGIFILVHGYLR